MKTDSFAMLLMILESFGVSIIFTQSGMSLPRAFFFSVVLRMIGAFGEILHSETISNLKWARERLRLE